MKKGKIIFGTLTVIGLVLLSSCMEKEESGEYAVWRDNDRGCFTDDGYYFVMEDENGLGNLLYYFDMESGNTVPVCDKAECTHRAVDLSTGESASCNAQIESDEIVAYRDKIYYFSGKDMKLCLRRRDKDGNQDEKVAEIDASYKGGRMWIYQERAFVMAYTSVSRSFDPESRESDDSVMKLFAVNLNNGKTDVLAESSLISAVNYAFQIYKMEDGKVYFYNLETDKWFIYDIESAVLQEQDNTKPGMKYGNAGEYVDICGKYCYDIFKDNDGIMKIMRLDLESGGENVLYKGEKGNIADYVICGLDSMYIFELNGDADEIENICFYDMETEEIKQAGGDFYEDFRVCVPHMCSDKGIIYSYAVNREQGEDAYSGNFEYRYMALEDMIAGTDAYQTIYYLNQEGE